MQRGVMFVKSFNNMKKHTAQKSKSLETVNLKRVFPARQNLHWRKNIFPVKSAEHLARQ